MKINVVGGGPAGLYFALLMKGSAPQTEITVFERNRPDDTFGFGVVFSDETLSHFRDADAETYDQIVAQFAYWDEIDTVYKGQVVRSTGHGFCGMSRVRLLNIMQRRCEALGVDIRYETDISDPERFRDADLVLAADGVNSLFRQTYASSFRPHVQMRPNRFVWLGSRMPLDAFTFLFKEDRHGIWNIHAYRYEEGLDTLIVETTEDAWLSAGMDTASEAETVSFVGDLFEEELGGYEILTNRSLWRAFPNVHCESWRHENVVILGDAAHTAHFSIGSGTKLAMEDAIALHTAVQANPGAPFAATAAYESARRVEVDKVQHAADVSLTWFENVRRFWAMDPVQFNFSMLTRSKQITYDNLARRDPDLVADVRRWFADSVRAQGHALPANDPPPLFTPFRLRDMTVANRVVVSPMCQYSATDGMPGDWHLVHLGSRAIGGAGLIVTEMTNVSAEARISPGCTGLYSPEHRDAWARIVDFVHSQSAAKICLQLGHAGRKGSTQLGWERMDHPLAEGNWPILSASALPYLPDSQIPREMTRADMDAVLADFVQAARWADEAGFDMLEVHMAHGYLLASFISPLTNRRDDEYGGGIEQRMRFPLEVFNAVRAVWPDGKPMSARISACDWHPEGLSGEDMVAVATLLKDHGCDLIDVSAGQTVADQEPVYGRMFQTPFSDQIRNEVDIATMAVGNITTADQVNTIVAAGRSDLVALARPHLSDPYFTLRAAAQYGFEMQAWPPAYEAGRDQALALAARDNEELAELRRQARPPKPQKDTLVGRVAPTGWRRLSPPEESARERPSGYPKAGIASLANHSSCSIITLCGVPIEDCTLTASRPG